MKIFLKLWTISISLFCFHAPTCSTLTALLYSTFKIIIKLFITTWLFLGCGGHIIRKSGTISSPNYPRAYKTNIECEWLIEVDYGYSVVIEFLDIDIEVTDQCEFDYIRVCIKIIQGVLLKV